MIKSAISKLVEGIDLSREEMERAMDQIMSGESTPAQIGSFITALRMKGETVEEIVGAANVMREKATRIEPRVPNGSTLIDTCGTGGDGCNTFNISTAAALVAAGAGAMVAKHGNKSVSSKCGSADVFEALGVKINIPPESVQECIDQVGIGFLFAPLLHGAMKHAIGPRRELGIRTVFNILGPLTNPAGAQAQLLGVFDPNLCEVLARVLDSLGCKQAMVVHGSGMDEISLSGTTRVSHLKNGEINNLEISPEEFGFKMVPMEELRGGDAKTNAGIIEDVLQGKPGPQRDVVLLNAAASLIIADRAPDFQSGIRMAAESIDNGQAIKKLGEMKQFTEAAD